MTAFLLAVKPKSSPSDKTPLTIESLIAIPKRTPDGRRITVQNGKVTVENRMTQFLLAEIIVGNLMTILWLSMEFEFCWAEYFAPLIHSLVFMSMMRASIESMNFLLVLTFFDCLLLSKLFFERLFLAMPYFLHESIWTVLKPEGPMFILFTWPLLRAFTLWMISVNLFLYGILVLQCKCDEVFIEQQIQNKSKDALEMV